MLFDSLTSAANSMQDEHKEGNDVLIYLRLTYISSGVEAERAQGGHSRVSATGVED